MKKVVIFSVLGLFVAGAGYAVISKKIKDGKKDMPNQIQVKLPNGQVVTAMRMPGPSNNPPSGMEIVIKGKIVKEMDETETAKQIVMHTETGEKYLLINSPYIETLEKKALGKQAKLKGIHIRDTSFKHYPALYIKDIVEIK